MYTRWWCFIWPVVHYQYLDLKPLSIEANLTNALSRQNIRVDVPAVLP
jgi:flotillin